MLCFAFKNKYLQMLRFCCAWKVEFMQRKKLQFCRAWVSRGYVLQNVAILLRLQLF